MPGQGWLPDRGERRGVEPARRAPILGGKPAQEEAGEDDRIGRPLAQRRHAHADLVQAIEQILAEAPVGHHPVEILVGRAHDPHVDLNRLASADPLDDLVLQKAQQLDLHRQRHVADLVEKQRAAMRALDPADGLPERPGKGAFFMAEQLAFEQASRE